MGQVNLDCDLGLGLGFGFGFGSIIPIKFLRGGKNGFS